MGEFRIPGSIGVSTGELRDRDPWAFRAIHIPYQMGSQLEPRIEFPRGPNRSWIKRKLTFIVQYPHDLHSFMEDGSTLTSPLYVHQRFLIGKLAISMASFQSYLGITRGYGLITHQKLYKWRFSLAMDYQLGFLIMFLMMTVFDSLCWITTGIQRVCFHKIP